MIRPNVESGQLRVLATTGDKRWFVFPDAPTLKESGFNVEYYAWSGFVAPAATPDAIIERINAAANQALAREEVRSALMANGFEIIGGKPEVFAKTMNNYIDSVRKIGSANQIQID
jgi:tripartite-type tricarboxylate transporter receptor subunit TctC